MTVPRTLLDKLWDAHEIVQRDDGTSLMWVDRHLVHEGSHHAFAKLKERGMPVAQPQLTFGVVDHYAPTRAGDVAADIRRMIKTLGDNATETGIKLFDLRDPGQGIVHVIGPEQGQSYLHARCFWHARFRRGRDRSRPYPRHADNLAKAAKHHADPLRRQPSERRHRQGYGAALDRAAGF
jgi:hypothetical protein